MPPLYGWKCEHCNMEVTVMHHHSESHTPPSAEELVEEKKTEPCTQPEHQWKLQIGKVSFTINGYSYRNGYS